MAVHIKIVGSAFEEAQKDEKRKAYLDSALKLLKVIGRYHGTTKVWDIPDDKIDNLSVLEELNIPFKRVSPQGKDEIDNELLDDIDYRLAEIMDEMKKRPEPSNIGEDVKSVRSRLVSIETMLMNDMQENDIKEELDIKIAKRLDSDLDGYLKFCDQRKLGGLKMLFKGWNYELKQEFLGGE